jgi:acyl-CoA synthetase (AMP-forming)/AMP-acid ligase II
VAHVFLRAGFKHGDCVALLMENRLEYVGLWLGCTKLGLVPALINHNLTGQPLLHSIRAASAKALIYGSEHSKAIVDISSEMDSSILGPIFTKLSFC